MRRGFSLIEVLIAVVVLALGLLGLGAIFPVVIAQQRAAFDSVRGTVVADYAIGLLSSDTGVVDMSGFWDDATGGLLLGIPSQQQAGPGGGTRPQPIGGSDLFYEWVVPNITGTSPSVSAPRPAILAQDSGDDPAGMWALDSQSVDVESSLPVYRRLYPEIGSGLSPIYVWDPVFRRTQNGSVQVAIFVRRIDQRVRVPQGSSLEEELTEVLPLRMDSTGRLAPNGELYPIPLAIPARVDPLKLNRLIIGGRLGTSPGVDTTLEYLRRSGQIIVDNTGTVRTVIGLDEDSSPEGLLVDPPFSPANAFRTPGDRDSTSVTQVVFTPNVPVAVGVYTLEKE